MYKYNHDDKNVSFLNIIVNSRTHVQCDLFHHMNLHLSDNNIYSFLKVKP